MATRGLGKSQDVKTGTSRVKPTFDQRLFLRAGDDLDIGLLDDESYNIWEHGIFLKGDKQAAKIKVTCPCDDEEGDPKNCRVCNAMLRHDLIGRNWRGFLTVVDMSSRVWKGKTYEHVKKFLPLDKRMAMILEKKRKKRGSLVGAMIHLYRTDSNASAVGDDWEIIDIKDPRVRFKDSPQIERTIEWVKKKDGTILTRKQALEHFVTPYDYDEMLAVDPKKITYLLAYMGIDDSVSDTDAGGTTVNYDEPSQYAGDGATSKPEPSPPKKAAGKKMGAKKKGVAKKKGAKKKGAKKKGVKKKGVKKKGKGR